MSDIYQTTVVAYGEVATAPPAPAAWDLLSFLENANAYIQIAGGALLMLLGVACLVWGGVVCVKTLFASPQSAGKESWVKIVMLIVVGGAFMGGGWPLISKIGSGGEKTITELGGGTILIGAPATPGSRPVPDVPGAPGLMVGSHTDRDHADPDHADPEHAGPEHAGLARADGRGSGPQPAGLDWAGLGRPLVRRGWVA